MKTEDTKQSIKCEKSECVEIDYEREYEILTYQNFQLKEELGKYKQALINICLKM